MSPASAKRVRHAKVPRWAAINEGIHDGYRKYECNSDDSSTTMPYDEESDFSATTMPYDEEEPDKDELHKAMVDENRRMYEADKKACLVGAKIPCDTTPVYIPRNIPGLWPNAGLVFHMDPRSENKKR